MLQLLCNGVRPPTLIAGSRADISPPPLHSLTPHLLHPTTLRFRSPLLSCQGRFQWTKPLLHTPQPAPHSPALQTLPDRGIKSNKQIRGDICWTDTALYCIILYSWIESWIVRFCAIHIVQIQVSYLVNIVMNCYECGIKQLLKLSIALLLYYLHTIL